MKLVQDVESAMEECLDQDVEILFPASTEATYVSRAAGRLSERHGPSAICSLPLRHGDDVKAVLTIERPREKEFQPEEIESMRLAADLATARLINLHEQDRWIGGKVAFSIRKGAGQVSCAGTARDNPALLQTLARLRAVVGVHNLKVERFFKEVTMRCR